MRTDAELIQEYAEAKAEAAFRELVERHLTSSIPSRFAWSQAMRTPGAGRGAKRVCDLERPAIQSCRTLHDAAASAA